MLQLRTLHLYKHVVEILFSVLITYTYVLRLRKRYRYVLVQAVLENGLSRTWKGSRRVDLDIEERWTFSNTRRISFNAFDWNAVEPRKNT